MKMRIVKEIIFLSILGLFLSSCASYQIRELSNNDAPHKLSETCYNKYSITISSFTYTNSFGSVQSDESEIERLKSEYIASTKKVLNRDGCNPVYTTNESEANLKVRIERSLYLSALPQEWLTGLSLGLIPSWGTRRSQYIYTFIDTETKTAKSYALDVTTYLHLFFIFASLNSDNKSDEFRVYEKTLIKYIKGS